MKKLLHGLSMAFSMFTAIPFPCRWNEGARIAQLLFLPAVGLFIGGLWALLAYGVYRLRLPPLIAGALTAVFPYAASGCIHLDGFMDTSDAVFSRRGVEEKRRILKDPHTGAFAVMALSLLLLLFYGAAASLSPVSFVWKGLLLIPFFSRVCAAWAMSALPLLPKSGYRTIQNQLRPRHIAALCVISFIAAVSAFVLGGASLLVLCLGVCAAYWLSLWYASASLGGVNGDVSGWALTWAELAGVIILSLGVFI